MLLSPGAWLDWGRQSVPAARPPPLISVPTCWWQSFLLSCVLADPLPFCSPDFFPGKAPELKGAVPPQPGAKATRKAGGMFSGTPAAREVLSKHLQSLFEQERAPVTILL